MRIHFMYLRPRVKFMAIFGVLGVGSFLLWITSSGPGINRQSFSRIEIGMREADVIELLRAQPGDYITGKPRVKVFSLTSDIPQLFPIDNFRIHRATEKQWVDPTVKEWYGRDGIVLVRFGREGSVEAKYFFEVVVEDEPLLDKVRRWIRL